MFATIRRFACLAFLILCGQAAAFPPTPTPVREYFNEFTGHYVLLYNPVEIANVNAGSAGPGWRPTGYEFEAHLAGQAGREFQACVGSCSNVCRFYAPSPTNSHFFTGNPAECGYLRDNNTGWIYEGVQFNMDMPVGGSCAAGLKPVYRFYNHRWMFSDSNHRFTPDPAVRNEMIERGWTDEGVAFCTLGWFRVAAQTFVIASHQIRPSAECENQAINLGPCIALNQLPIMPNRVTGYLPPSWVVRNPDYPVEANAVTGLDAHEIHTAYPTTDRMAVVTHSFVQIDRADVFGIHVNSRERTAGNLSSINPLYQFITTAPAAGATDRRVFPWAGARDHELVVSFDLALKTIRRANPQSHAYGHPTLQFEDFRGGNHLYVTLGAYGSVNGPDIVIRDGTTGYVIVSTSFRDNPRFGARLSGQWIPCNADASSNGCTAPTSQSFKFRINRGDFRKVLDLARTANPGLSADPADYLLDNFHFNNEVFLDGEIGVTLSDYRLEIFGY